MKNCRNVTLATHHLCQPDEMIIGDYHITDEFCSYPSVKADLFFPHMGRQTLLGQDLLITGAS